MARAAAFSARMLASAKEKLKPLPNPIDNSPAPSLAHSRLSRHPSLEVYPSENISRHALPPIEKGTPASIIAREKPAKMNNNIKDVSTMNDSAERDDASAETKIIGDKKAKENEFLNEGEGDKMSIKDMMEMYSGSHAEESLASIGISQATVNFDNDLNENICEIFKLAKFSNQLPSFVYNLLTDGTSPTDAPQQPKLLISLIGSALDGTPKLRPRLLKDFELELREVAKRTDAWFFTDGTKAGISSILGCIKEGEGNDFPVIGCCKSTDITYSESIDFHPLVVDEIQSPDIRVDRQSQAPASPKRRKVEFWSEIIERSERMQERMKGSTVVSKHEGQYGSKKRELDANHSHIVMTAGGSHTPWEFQLQLMLYIAKGQFDDMVMRHCIVEKDLHDEKKTVEREARKTYAKMSRREDIDWESDNDDDARGFSFQNLEGQEMNSDNGFNCNPDCLHYIPSLCFVFGGSHETIHMAHSAMAESIPLVLALGSEGFVTIMLLYMEHYDENDEDTAMVLQERLNALCKKTMQSAYSAADFDECKAKVIQMIKWYREDEAFIYVYNLNKTGNDQDEERNARVLQTLTTKSSSAAKSVELKFDHTCNDGSLFEICEKALVYSNHLSLKSKIFLSVGWNSTEYLQALLAGMPLNADDTPIPAKYFFEGEVAAFAAYHDKGEILSLLYEFGLLNEYLDALIGYELGLLECKSKELKTDQRSKHYAAFKKAGMVSVALKSPKSPKMKLALDKIKVKNSEMEMLKFDRSCPNLLRKDNLIPEGAKSMPASWLFNCLSLFKSAAVHLATGDLVDFAVSRKKELSWFKVNFLVDHERNYHDVRKASSDEEERWEPKARVTPQMKDCTLNRAYLDKVMKLDGLALPFCEEKDFAFAIKNTKSAFYEQYDMRKRMVNEITGELVNDLVVDWNGQTESSNSTKLTYMHRAWWAVITRRHSVAKIFVDQSPLKIATAILVAGAYRDMSRSDRINEAEFLRLADEYDELATSCMDQMNESEALGMLPNHQVWFERERRFDRRFKRTVRVQKKGRQKVIEDIALRSARMSEDIAREVTSVDEVDISDTLPYEKYIMDSNVFYTDDYFPLNGRQLRERSWRGTAADSFNYCNGFRLFGDLDGAHTIVDLAMKTRNKKFISHNHVQAFLDGLWYLPCGEPDEYEPNETKRLQTLRIPLHCSQKMYWSLAFDLVWLAMFTNFVIAELFTDKLFSNFEIFFWFYVFGFVLEEMQQLNSRNWNEYVTGAHNVQDSLIVVLCLVSFFLRLVTYYGFVEGFQARGSWHYLETGLLVAQMKDLSRVFLSVSYVLASTRLLEKFSFYKSVGILMVMTKRMIVNDVFPYLVFCFALIFCTGFAMKGMFGIPIWSTFMMFLGDWSWEDFGGMYNQGFSSHQSVSNANVSDVSLVGETPSTSYEDANDLWKFLAQVFFVTYIIITNIVLVNLLIAQMSDTYAKIMEEADQEWKFIRADVIKDVYHSSTLPPPLNIFNAAGAFVCRVLHAILGRKGVFFDLKARADRAYSRPGRDYRWDKIMKKWVKKGRRSRIWKSSRGERIVKWGECYPKFDSNVQSKLLEDFVDQESNANLSQTSGSGGGGGGEAQRATNSLTEDLCDV